MSYSLNSFDELDPARTALVVIDMQTAFLEPSYCSFTADAVGIVGRINALAADARASGATVVWTRHTVLDDPDRGPPAWQLARPELALFFDGLRPDSPGHPLDRRMDARDGDLIVDKVRYSAFLPLSSDLDARLRARGIDTVVIVGTVTDVCCESSVRDAHMMNYRTFFVEDATAAMDEAHHQASLRIIRLQFADVRNAAEMARLFREAGAAAGAA